MRLRRLFLSLSTKRIRFVVAYDGTDFCGWAPQAGQRTVHRTLTEGVRQVSGEDVEITGASRTDSGAHARGQVCHFDQKIDIPAERWPRAINQVLPRDLTVLRADEVPNDFHSRFSAQNRFYRFRIMMGDRDPHRMRYTWFYGKNLDIAAMQAGAARLVGEHNFLAFSQLLEPHQTSVRTLYKVDVRHVRDEVWIDVVGTAFVRGMMRRISGSLWEIGRGKYAPDWIDDLLAQRDRAQIKWPTLLPACGLTLMKVKYGRHPRDHRIFPSLAEGIREDNDE